MAVPQNISLPGAARFAFTVVDDTDMATVANVKPVYDLLHELGMRTTKTLWTLEATRPNPYDGSQTAQDPRYREFLSELQARNFELALHGVRQHSSPREDIERGLGEFSELFGQGPRMHINHFTNDDNVYWGAARVSGAITSAAYKLAASTPASQGHQEGSRYFWGDICRDQIDYVRSFTVRETNLDNLATPLAYVDPERPFVNGLFLSTEGGELPSFLEAISEQNQDQLADNGGVCIMYTHFGAGFVENDQLNGRFESLMRRLAGLGGWFPTASELLDHFYPSGPPTLSARQRGRIERRWLKERLRHGSS
jgi:hypothetical protein